MSRLVAVVGPTAVGKSRLAFDLARTLNGEVIGADSRQVYRHLDIGTAKPGRQELSVIPHHLIDIINPDQDFSLAQYHQLAYRTISDVQQQDKLPLLVGGSGLYVWSVLEGWGIPPVPPDPELRQSLAEKAAEGGVDELYQELARIDPVAAERVDRRNVRRLIRALEVSKHSRTRFSRLRKKQSPPFDILIIGLTADRVELYRRIDLRIDQMVEQGLVEEVKSLVAGGYGFDLPAMSGIGYKQIGLFLGGEMPLETAIQQIKTETHRLVRRQYNWFRPGDKRIHWFDIQSEHFETEITELVAGFIQG